ncbi:helix-turn-helix domain-containing protein [Gramella lutea]|uniref:Helix-turn-helix domain-containing protein n=1 Tax=Christiangramia lutea TaxID=1607951 RepID=A0A9X2ACH0_9FLAO|nr:helix-turn-helix domain-containing protein [Christiangramia lutea]MCH4824472.1 helix-turn-helix domain-containing protein [Christiangramia lutea]
MGHFKFKILLFLVILSGSSSSSYGQTTVSAQKIQAIDAFLKAEEVHIQKDQEENLWITTPVKVTRYNSVEVQDYNKFRGMPTEIGKDYQGTYSDSENNIWVYAEKGLAIFQPGKDSFEFVSDITGKIYSMREDSGNQLWIAAENGVFKLNIDSDKKDFGISRFLSENTMAVDIALFNDKIIFAGPNGILSIDRRSGKFKKVDMGYFQDLPITTVEAVGGNILVGTNGKGLFKIDSDLNNFQKVYTLPAQFGNKKITGMEFLYDEVLLSIKGSGIARLDKNLAYIPVNNKFPDDIYSIYLDDSNLLWMVAREGLFLSNFSGYAVKKLQNDPARYSSLANDFVTAVETDSKGSVWFGTADGLSIWDTRTDRWRHIKNLNFKRNFEDPDEITDLVAAGDHMWIATANDGVYKINIHTLLRAHYSTDALYKTKIKAANTVFTDAGENVWIGGNDGFLTRISPNNQIKNYPLIEVQAIGELGPKKIIIATRSRVHSLDPYSGRITDLEKLNANSEMDYYAVNDLKITHSGIGLFATKGAGLISYNFKTEEITVLNKQNALPSNNINGIELDDNSGYWLTSDKGLVFYNSEDENVKLYSELHGLSSTEINTAFAKLENGAMVFGGSKGVNIFKPKTMLAQQDFKPRLELRSFTVPKEKNNGNENIDLAVNRQVEIDENSGFRINFAGISHLAPDSILYSWKLTGLEEEWSKPIPVNHANYANLAPGNYTFLVKAKLVDSGWTQPESIDLNVAGLGSSVSSVYLFMGISVLAMVAIFVVVFIKRSRNADKAAREELRQNLQKEFKQPVESAVKSLNKISAEALKGDPEDLQRYAARFDDLFNQILNFNYQGSVYEISKINLEVHIPKVLDEIKPVFKSRDLEVILNNQWGGSEFYYNLELLDKVIFSMISGSAGYTNNKAKIILNLIETNIGDLKIQVTDNGRGIPENDLKVIEKKRSINTTKRLRDKSGLRYIIKAKELILEAGGSFSYETELNEGSTFTAVVKNRKGDYRKVPERAASILKKESIRPVTETKVLPGIKNLSECKILIIENELESRELLVNEIGKYCQVYQAVSAEEGLDKAGMIFPDIIISAAMFPDMNAVQLSKMLKRNTGLNHINIFLLAEQNQAIHDLQLEEISIVIKKPIDMNLLLGKLTEVLNWQKDLRKSFVQSYIDHTKPEFRSERDKKFIQDLTDRTIQNIKNESFSVHDLSSALGVSSNTLFMKLKSLVDLSPQDFMEFTRLNYARDLMEHTDMNVMEIAYKSGFSSPSIFYESYKKFYGYSLTEAVDKDSE